MPTWGLLRCDFLYFLVLVQLSAHFKSISGPLYAGFKFDIFIHSSIRSSNKTSALFVHIHQYYEDEIYNPHLDLNCVVQLHSLSFVCVNYVILADDYQ